MYTRETGGKKRGIEIDKYTDIWRDRQRDSDTEKQMDRIKVVVG